MKPLTARAFATSLLLASAVLAQTPTHAPRAAWVQRSDEHAQVLVRVLARFAPERAGELGVAGFDEEVVDLKPRRFERSQEATREALAELERRRDAEKDPLVRQDLEIMIGAARDNLRSAELSQRYEVPYFDVAATVYGGLRALLDEQVAPERRRAALPRLRKYAGMASGSTPLATLAEARVRERLAEPGLLGPPKVQVEKDLGNTSFYMDGIGKLFARYGVSGFEEPLAALKLQIAAYDAFVRKEVLPRARTDFRLPAELYADRLKRRGIDMAPGELAERGRIGFMEIRNEMRALAPLVAREKGLAGQDYRDVLRALKKDQLVGETILPHYRERLRVLEEIIRRERVVALPAREARIRLATEAESASLPAPNMRPPRMLGNTGEAGEFLLPLSVPTRSAGGAEASLQRLDDFTFDAASWTLTVHEARPGHELQFDSIVEKGVSIARAVFALNSVNGEGWALYMEAEMKPYMPLDGQLVSLQHRLMRAARAFLDPDLQMGRIQPEEAVRFLMDEVVLSEPMARQEVERYTFRMPGQAPSYFYGYTRWLQVRARAEQALGTKFDRQRYHDFILGQGLLPPDVLGEAVMAEFVPAQKSRTQ